MRVFLLFIVLFGVIFASFDECPKVYDGLQGRDLSEQDSNSTLASHWDSVKNAINYEVAVVSSNFLKGKVLTDTCRSEPGFMGVADVKNWFNVQKVTSVTFKNLKLVVGNTYYVVLRTTLLGGSQVYSSSNGILIKTQDSKTRSVREDSESSTVKQHNEHTRYPSHRNNLRSTPSLCDQHTCDIDEENRCRRAQISVQDYLNEFYGPPKFADNLDLELFGFVVPVFIDDDGADDDDDDGYSSAEKGGIILGVVLGALLLFLLCLCVLAVLAIILNPGEGATPFDESIVTRKQNVVDADMGTTTQHEIGSSGVRVEFPDIDPQSNLSSA